MGELKKTAAHKLSDLESAVAGGLTGAALGAVFSGKSEHAFISSLIGSALGASLNALHRASNAGMGVLFTDGGNLYERLPDGKTRFVKKMAIPAVTIPRTFIIK